MTSPVGPRAELRDLQAESDAINVRVGEITGEFQAGSKSVDLEEEFDDLMARSIVLGPRIEHLYDLLHHAYLRELLADGTRLAGEPGEG